MYKIALLSASLFAVTAVSAVIAEETGSDNPVTNQEPTVWMFNEVDANHDMKITPEELEAKGGVLAKFKQADTDNNGTLDEQEFVAIGEAQR